MAKVKAKTRKSILKRFKITKTGKILRRICGQDHYLAKKSSKKKRQMRKMVPLTKSEAKLIKRYLTYPGK
jgi:large subunit ribosomal protein L35